MSKHLPEMEVLAPIAVDGTLDPSLSTNDLVEHLSTLNQISQALNQAIDVQGVLDDALGRLVKLMGLETGWIILKDPQAEERFGESRYLLAAHHNLPPALAPDKPDAWGGSCACQELIEAGRPTKAYNEVYCSRLKRARGSRRGLVVHASAPLRSGDQMLGMLNVAAPDWESFSPQALSLLTNVGSQMGIALERARLFDVLKQQRWQEQEALLSLSRRLLSHLDLDDLISHMVEDVRYLLSADACALLLPAEEPGFLEFSATTGWHRDPVQDKRKVPADGSNGPGRAMQSRDLLLVPDIREHDTRAWMPDWLQAEGFVGYAVVPLLLDGRPVGVLLLNQREPRSPRDGEVRFLQLMAGQAAMAIEKSRLHEEEVKMQALEKDLALGQQIQLSLLPKSRPSAPGWEFAAFYQAAREVGGDFYDFIELPGEPRRLGMVIADVVGKGVAAALFMARGSTIIHTAALANQNPRDTLSQANSLILQHQNSELFVTAFYAVLDTNSGVLEYSSAGHNPPLWHRSDTGQCHELRVPGIVLGIFQQVALENHQVTIAPGDYLVLYTDGVTEAMNADRAFFDQKRLEATIAANAGGTAQQVLEAIVERVRVFAGDIPPSDDITLMVVRRCPGGV
jgi:serine phosphatase RsbU (regulator of sigma subunit)